MDRVYTVGVMFCVVAGIVLAVYYFGGTYPVVNGDTMLGDVYPYTFVFFGDNQPEQGATQPEVFIHMIEMINADNPLFTIGGGDFVADGTPEQFEAFLQVISGLDSHMFYVCGNHDNSVYYTKYLGEKVYAFTYKNSIFIILDNSRKILSQDQLTFLETQLKKGYENTFVIMHIPPFDPEGTHAMIHPDKFLAIVQEYKVDYVLCSHIHGFYEEKIGDTILIISGGGGGPLHRGGDHHYIVVTVSDTIQYEKRCVP
ncbi:MAG: metallophosphoesterase [Candidatus Methanofastidiosia archaeon]|jgi:predicted phosphodiesterase